MAQFLATGDATITPMREEQWADVLRRQGEHVICHRGRYWMEPVRGFYEPVHWLAALTDEEATRPTLACWGFRSRLDDSVAGRANGTMPIHMCADVAGYSEATLSAGRRNHLRRCHKRVRMVQVKDAGILLDQGRSVLLSAIKRTGYGHALEAEEYAVHVQRLVDDPHMLVLAGLVDDRLAGYMTGYAVTDIAYIQSVYLATEFLSTYMGTGLPFEFVQICRRAGSIRQVIYGLHSIEDAPLCTFKLGMGFPPKSVPTRLSLYPMVRALLRYRYPYKFYRLTGCLPKAA